MVEWSGNRVWNEIDLSLNISVITYTVRLEVLPNLSAFSCVK